MHFILVAEQRALAGTREEKENLWYVEEGAGHSGRQKRSCEAMQGEN